VELQTWAAQVRMDRMSNLLVVNWLDCVSVESAARRGKKLQRAAVALLAAVSKCWV